MSGLFGSITIKGNRLTEFASQTSTVGIPMPFGFGKFPCEGNIIFAPMPPKEHVKKKKQGKGGVKTEEYSYTLSYAIAFCEGPIFGYWTIKRNGKIVWTQDPNASVDDRAYAAKWARKATFYYGTETQLPDSTIESYKGAGRVSAHRGVAYIVVEDDDVTDNGGAVPTYEAVIIASPPDVYLTSRPYNYDYSEHITIKRVEAETGNYDFNDYFINHKITAGLGKFNEIVNTYKNWPTENLALSGVYARDGTFRSVVASYDKWPQENLRLNSASARAGTFKVVLIVYPNWQPEYLKATDVKARTGTFA